MIASNGLTFKPLTIQLTDKVLSSDIVQKKFLLNGKTRRIHLHEFPFPFRIPVRLKLLELIGVYFLLSQVFFKPHWLSPLIYPNKWVYELVNVAKKQA